MSKIVEPKAYYFVFKHYAKMMKAGKQWDMFINDHSLDAFKKSQVMNALFLLSASQLRERFKHIATQEIWFIARHAQFKRWSKLGEYDSDFFHDELLDPTPLFSKKEAMDHLKDYIKTNLTTSRLFSNEDILQLITQMENILTNFDDECGVAVNITGDFITVGILYSQ
jgi:hypothetical protein